MNIDDPELSHNQEELPFDKNKVLAKASFIIITLLYYQMSPPTRVLV